MNKTTFGLMAASAFALANVAQAKDHEKHVVNGHYCDGAGCGGKSGCSQKIETEEKCKEMKGTWKEVAKDKAHADKAHATTPAPKTQDAAPADHGHDHPKGHK